MFVNRFYRSMHTQFGIASLALVLLATAASQPAIADQIIEVRNGSATIQRDNKPQTAGVGTTLRSGDEIRPTAGTVVTILCNDNTTRQVRRASGLGNVCPGSVITRFNTRGRGGCDFLTFLNQRCVYATQVMVADPTLRWNPIVGASQYQIQISQSNQAIWQQTATGTQLPYQGTALQPGEAYQLLVTPVGKDSEPSYHLSLERLDDTQTQAVQQAIAQIQTQSLSPEGTAIALSIIYQEAGQSPGSNKPGLVWEAIATLEPLIASGNSTPYIHRLLGDLYLQVGLLELAAPRYQSAINLAQEASDWQNQASAAAGLANIAAAQGDRTAAGQWLRQAKEGYVMSGDTRQVELVDQWLRKLETP